MRSHIRRARLWPVALLGCAGLLAAERPSAGRAEPQDVVRVQEDWELVVGAANEDREAPQVLTIISPTTSDDGFYALFELNHQSFPAYQRGGLQLQVWSGEELVGFKDNVRTDLLGSEGEVITWTQEMDTSAGPLRFRILDGHSSTWGEFAPEGTLYLHAGVIVANLNSYHPEFSVSRSGVLFAANRVHSLVLKRVRLYSSQGLIAEDDTERPVELAQ